MSEPTASETGEPREHDDAGPVAPLTPQHNRVLYFCFWVFLLIYSKIWHRMEVRGRHRIPREGPLLVLSNHASYLDPPLVASCLQPRKMTFMAKSDLWKNPLMGWFITSLGAFPIKRGAGDRAALSASVRLLREGHSIIVFPEGTRTTDGSLQEAKTGVSMLIAQVPDAWVLPVRIDGSFESMGGSKHFPRPAKIRITFAEPFRLSDLKGLPTVKKQLYHALGAEIMSRIAQAAP
jgi:1-acyl-sn-glycerol-3-phosphate acyltransferase